MLKQNECVRQEISDPKSKQVVQCVFGHIIDTKLSVHFNCIFMPKNDRVVLDDKIKMYQPLPINQTGI